MFTQNQRLIVIMLTVGILLLIPFIAMMFTNEVNWSLFDFIIAGVLLMGTGLSCEFVMRKVQKTSHRIAICAGLLFVLAIVWIELAVGIFGTPFAGN
jgi:hypothetical protein